MALIEQLPLEIDALSLLSEALNFDFATKGMDEPFTDAELAGIVRAAGDPRPRGEGQRQAEPDGARLHGRAAAAARRR